MRKTSLPSEIVLGLKSDAKVYNPSGTITETMHLDEPWPLGQEAGKPATRTPSEEDTRDLLI